MADKGMPSIQNWRTPRRLFEALHNEFHFTLDVAASEENALCFHYIDEATDATSESISWLARSMTVQRPFVWCNPPYSNIKPFLYKAVAELDRGVGSVFLIPAAVELKYWQETVWRRAAEVRLVSGRLAFEHPDTGEPVKGNRYNSAIVVFRPFWPGAVPHVYNIEPYWEDDENA